MTRAVLYMAHPVSPSAEEISSIDGNGQHPEPKLAAFNVNIGMATCWLAWLCESFPETTFIAPWFALRRSLRSEAWGIDTRALVERCDGIVLVGGRISDEMRANMEHGISRPSGVGLFGNPAVVYDLTSPLGVPKIDIPQSWSFAYWARPYLVKP